MGAWAGCDELEVLGTKKVGSSAKALKDSGFDVKEKFMVGKYASPDKDLLAGLRICTWFIIQGR